MASGCTGCDGKATYATITKVIFDQKDSDVKDIAIEDGDTSMKKNSSKELNAYVVFNNTVPHLLDTADVTWTSSQTSVISITSGTNVAVASQTGTSIITAVATVAGNEKTATATYTVIA